MQRSSFRFTAVAVVAACLAVGPSAHAGQAQPTRCKVRNVDSRENSDSLATAIAAASSGDTLKVMGVCVGVFSLRKDLTLTSWNRAKPATLDGDGAGTVVKVSQGVTATLIGLVITDGWAHEGGGIANRGTLTLIDSTVRGNSATGTLTGGGGIANGSGTLTLDHSIVQQNTASGHLASGGGIRNGFGTVVLKDSIVRENTAAGDSIGEGGGIYSSFGNVRVNRSVVEGNAATAHAIGEGGGIFSSFGPLRLEDSVVQQNSAVGDLVSAGGIFNNAATARLNDSTVRANTATGDRSSDGGGIFNNFGHLILSGTSTVTSNAALSPPGSATAGGILNNRGTVRLLGSSAVFGNIPDDCYPSNIC
jgi:hypothetical protein